MDLHRVSLKYDNDPAYNAITSDFWANVQFASYDGNQPDGSFRRRRTVSMAPNLVLPAGRVVQVYDDVWILSDPLTDGFHATPIRKTCSARKSDGLHYILDAKELVEEDTDGRQVHAFRRFLKGTQEPSKSYLEPYHEISLGVDEEPVQGMFIRQGNTVWHVAMSYKSEEGFLIAEADEIVSEAGYDSAFLTIDTPGVIDPVTFQETGGGSFPAVFTDRHRFYRKLDQSQPSNYHGDGTLIVARSTGRPAQFKIAGEDYTTLAHEIIPGGYALHVRKV